VLAHEDRLVVESAPSLSFTYLAFNLRDPLTADPAVRHAIALAIDRAEVIRRKLMGRADLSVGMMAPASWAHAQGLAPTAADRAAAERLLDDAGYPRDPQTGVRCRLDLKLSNNRFRRSVARTVADQLRRVGIAVDLRSFEQGTFLQDIRDGNFQATMLVLPEPSEPDMLRWMFYSRNTPDLRPAATGPPAATLDRRFFVPGLALLLDGADPECRAWADQELRAGVERLFLAPHRAPEGRDVGNRTYYANARIDCLLMRGWAEPEWNRRLPLYDEVQAILRDELPVIPLWHEHNVIVRSRRLVGYEILPNGRLTGLARARIAPEAGP